MRPFIGVNDMNIELKTAAAYIRVSTDDQTELSPDSQIKLIRQFAKQHGYIVPKEFIFRDDGLSGKFADKRPGFIQMIANAKQDPPPFSAVLLWKFSRFARNQEESIFYKSIIRKKGIEVLSVSEPIIEGPFGSLIERIIEWTDEYYCIRLSGEVKRGMTEKVERGGAVSIPSFGYDIIDKKYVINEDQAPLVKKIFSDFLNGKGIIPIAKEFNAMGIKTNRGGRWENRTIEYILRNPVYIGKIRWNPKRRTRRNYDDPDIMIVDGIHEPLIDTATFEQTQALLADIKKKYRPYTHNEVKREYMLHGLVKCSSCGASLGIIGNRSNPALQCVKYTHGKCGTSHYVNLKKINSIVIDGIAIAFESMNYDLIVKHDESTAPEIDTESLIAKDQLKLRRVKEAYEDGVYTLAEYKESKEQIEEHIKALSRVREQRQNDIEDIKANFVEKNKNAIATLRDPSVDESIKGELLRSFVDHIVFFNNTGEVRIYFFE